MFPKCGKLSRLKLPCQIFDLTWASIHLNLMKTLKQLEQLQVPAGPSCVNYPCLPAPWSGLTLGQGMRRVCHTQWPALRGMQTQDRHSWHRNCQKQIPQTKKEAENIKCFWIVAFFWTAEKVGEKSAVLRSAAGDGHRGRAEREIDFVSAAS